jgi:hypothetical protein
VYLLRDVSRNFELHIILEGNVPIFYARGRNPASVLQIVRDVNPIHCVSENHSTRNFF